MKIDDSIIFLKKSVPSYGTPRTKKPKSFLSDYARPGSSKQQTKQLKGKAIIFSMNSIYHSDLGTDLKKSEC